MQYASIGDIVFEITSYKQHSENQEYIYAKHQTILPPSNLQFMGTELREINIAIRFHREFCNPLEEYKKLQEIAKQGTAQKLIIANTVVGDFVIKKMNAEFQQIDVWGKPIVIDCNIELLEYIEKQLEQKNTTTKKKEKQKKQYKNNATTKDKKNAEKIITRKTNPDGYQYHEITQRKQ
jgi:phage protein U